VPQVEQRLVSALAEQLEQRRAALTRGARQVGWKLGLGERESIGGEIAVGYLTSATVLNPGGRYRAVDGAELHADAEAVVELGRDVDPEEDARAAAGAIARYGAALELVDLAPLPGEPDSVVAANVFHRAVAFSGLQPIPPVDLTVGLSVNGRLRAAAAWPDDLAERLSAAARLLDAVGERLRAGDRIITGSIVQVPIDVSDEVVAHFGELGAVGVQIGARS
jgi:2-keto-4-pentenoate hydratase